MLGCSLVPIVATQPGVVLKVAVFRKHLSFSICHPQRGIDKRKMLSKKISLILQDNNSGIQPICGKVGLVGQVWMGGHGTHSVPWIYTGLNLPAERVGPITVRRGGIAIHPGATPLCTWLPPPPPRWHHPPPLSTGGGGNATTEQQHFAQLK